MIIIKKKDVYTKEFKETIARDREVYGRMMAKVEKTKVRVLLKIIDERKAEIIKGRSLDNE